MPLGIIPRTFPHIMKSVESRKGKEFVVSCSYVEIDNELIYDLLDKEIGKTLKLKESKDAGTYIEGVKIESVKSVEELDWYLKLGHNNRMISATVLGWKMPSRSHTIFTIYIEGDYEDKTKNKSNEETVLSVRKINLIDLAGSERTSSTSLGKPEKFYKAISINALKNVIHSLSTNTGHIPFRDSKLTHLLKESFVGMTETAMIAVLSPADVNYNESLDTLKIASKARGIQINNFNKQLSQKPLVKGGGDDFEKLKKEISYEKKVSLEKMTLDDLKTEEDSEISEESKRDD